MSTSANNEQELRQRNSSSKDKDENKRREEEEEETEVVALPRAADPFSSDEPGPLTKAKLTSLLIVLFSVFMDFMGMYVTVYIYIEYSRCA